VNPAEFLAKPELRGLGDPYGPRRRAPGACLDLGEEHVGGTRSLETRLRVAAIQKIVQPQASL